MAEIPPEVRAAVLGSILSRGRMLRTDCYTATPYTTFRYTSLGMIGTRLPFFGVRQH